MERAALKRPLRRGWTTGTCAAAASRAAYQALLTGAFPDPVPVLLPGGTRAAFALAVSEAGADFAQAGVVKDAGDDPDVTHGALIVATVRRGEPGSGVVFRAGEGGPTVILDSGMAVPAAGWILVQPEVARFARVCSYDRAGYGWSEPGPEPRSADDVEVAALVFG